MYALYVLFFRAKGDPTSDPPIQSTQLTIYILLAWQFGLRPGCLTLNPSYQEADGELQCLLFKVCSNVYKAQRRKG